MTISDKLYAILIQGGSWKTILGGLWVTVQIFVLALVLGTVLGAVICLMRTRKNPVLRGIASVYIAVLRGTPVLMLLLLLYYGVFARTGLKPVTVAVFTFALNVSAHVAELLRSALSASDRGQAEAARTLGFSAWDTFRLITLPQVLVHHREPDPVDQRGGLRHHHGSDPRHQQHRLPHHAAALNHHHRHADLSGAFLHHIRPVCAVG